MFLLLKIKILSSFQKQSQNSSIFIIMFGTIVYSTIYCGVLHHRIPCFWSKLSDPINYQRWLYSTTVKWKSQNGTLCISKNLKSTQSGWINHKVVNMKPDDRFYEQILWVRIVWPRGRLLHWTKVCIFSVGQLAIEFAFYASP